MAADSAPAVRLRVTGSPSGGAPGTGSPRGQHIVEVGLNTGAVRLGRRAGSEVELPFPSVSSAHARLLLRDGQWFIEDLGSVNGTWVSGARLARGAPLRIGAGTSFRIADVAVVFEGEVRPEARPVGEVVHGTETIARRLVADLFGGLPGRQPTRLVVTQGLDEGCTLVIVESGRRYRVGRARTCDLRLADPDSSREQVEIERRWEGLVVRDPGSKNGFELDGVRVDRERIAVDGQILSIGATRIQIDDPESRYLEQVRRGPEASPSVPYSEPGDPDKPAERPPEPVVMETTRPIESPTVSQRSGAASPHILVVVAAIVLVAMVALAALFLGSGI